MRGRVPVRMRVLAALKGGPDWDSITPAEVVEGRGAQEKLRRSALGAFITGRSDRDAVGTDHTLELADRTVRVRVHRPVGGGSGLPLIVAFHGGGFISGVPEQDDWLLSHLAAECPAVVASVDYRLAPEHAVQRIALPEGFDARAMSPMFHDDLAGSAPTLIVSAGLDPLEDQSPAYAARLRQAGVEVTLTRYPEAIHGFLSMSGLIPAARPARAEILDHLRSHLAVRSGAHR